MEIRAEHEIIPEQKEECSSDNALGHHFLEEHCSENCDVHDHGLMEEGGGCARSHLQASKEQHEGNGAPYQAYQHEPEPLPGRNLLQFPAFGKTHDERKEQCSHHGILQEREYAGLKLLHADAVEEYRDS